MRRFLIICLAAVFTLPAADANTIFWKGIWTLLPFTLTSRDFPEDGIREKEKR